MWCQLRSRLRRRLPVTHLVARATQLKIPITDSTTLPEASSAIAKLRLSILAIHKESNKRRQEHVLDLANISEDKGDDKKAKILREMAKQERRNEAYACLGVARGKSIKQQNIDRIQVPISWPTFDNYSSETPLDLQDPKTVTYPADWRKIKCPAEIELMLKRCRRVPIVGDSNREKNWRIIPAKNTHRAPLSVVALRISCVWNLDRTKHTEHNKK